MSWRELRRVGTVLIVWPKSQFLRDRIKEALDPYEVVAEVDLSNTSVT